MTVILDLGDEPVPHPALVAAQRPRPRDVAEMAALLGWLPCEPYLNPAAPVRRSEEGSVARVRVHPVCQLPADECVCFEGEDDSPARLRQAIREAGEGKVTPWEYDGDENSEEDDTA